MVFVLQIKPSLLGEMKETAKKLKRKKKEDCEREGLRIQAILTF